MAYLALDDYSLRISVENLTEILDEAVVSTGLTADNIRNNAESWAQATIKSYLTTKYDITTEFAIDSPAARNFLIMQIMIDLVLCTIHKTINPRDVPDHVAKACEAAMKWLDDARSGTIVVDLDPKTDEDGNTNPQRTFIGSQTKFISKPYVDPIALGDDFIDG